MSDGARSPLAAVAAALESIALRPTQTVVTARDGSRTLQSLRSGEVHETLEPARGAPPPSDAASMSVSDVARQLADDPTRAWEVLQPRQTVRALPLSDFSAERPQADADAGREGGRRRSRTTTGTGRQVSVR